MTKWEEITPKTPVRSARLAAGSIQLNIEQKPNGENWQYFQLSFGRNAKADHDACREAWPREALEIARGRLDEFERQLGEVES